MKKVEGKRIKEVKDWLLSVISLVVIMGLPWIIGIFVLEYDELAPLAYIYTIIVAFQGLFIFLVLVVFSKAVRKAYIKFWNEEIRRSTNSSERVSVYVCTNTFEERCEQFNMECLALQG